MSVAGGIENYKSMVHSQIAVVDDCLASVSAYRGLLDSVYQTQYFDSWKAVAFSLSTRSYQPCLVVADLGKAPDNSFFSIMKSEHRSLLENRVVIVARSDDPGIIQSTLDGGAVDYLVVLWTIS